MADVINLRRARKAKARAADDAEAANNRVQHGVAKTVRDLQKAKADKSKQHVDAHKLNECDK
ncbi:MAG TPA: DUF4169 family protein [Rhizomicrobium sp.]|jgi:hypothetical protein|nr:DUF4169 family protein [Rhizomicrobium sp.]